MKREKHCEKGIKESLEMKITVPGITMCLGTMYGQVRELTRHGAEKEIFLIRKFRRKIRNKEMLIENRLKRLGDTEDMRIQHIASSRENAEGEQILQEVLPENFVELKCINPQFEGAQQVLNKISQMNGFFHTEFSHCNYNFFLLISFKMSKKLLIIKKIKIVFVVTS